MKTIITAQCLDQTLTLTNSPKLASGGENVFHVEVTFDSYWSGYGKEAVFYKDKSRIFHVVMTDDMCVIPWELTAEPGRVHFSVRGVKGSTTRSSEEIILSFVQGAPLENNFPEPLPDVYKQLLYAYGEASRAMKVEGARIDNLVENSGTGDDAELIDMRVDANGVTHATAGGAVRESVSAQTYELPLDTSFVAGGYINGSSGVVGTMSTFSYTDYINVEACANCQMTLLCVLYSGAGYAFYDKAKKFISGASGTSVGNSKATLQYTKTVVPEHAKYLRFSTFNDTTTDIGDFRVFVSVTPTKVDTAVDSLAQKLLLAPETAFTEGYGVRPTGELGSHSLLEVSDYIDVSAYKMHDIEILCNLSAWAGFAFYDASKVCVAGESGTTLGLGVTDANTNYKTYVPAEAHYLRYTNYLGNEHGVVISTTGRALKHVQSDLAEIQEHDNDYTFGLGRILCIGDSLTAGAYYGEWGGSNGGAIAQNYPHYLGRMLNTDVTNSGVSGYTTEQWWTNCSQLHAYSDYDTAIIWLGTNAGLSDTLAVDVDIYGHYASYAETQTGYYCRIIERIKEDNPDVFIVLCNVFASTGDVAETNTTIAKIADKYNAVVIDMSDLTASNAPELHAGISNPHFGKAGNLFVASRIKQKLSAMFAENPLLLEFGLTGKED